MPIAVSDSLDTPFEVGPPLDVNMLSPNEQADIRALIDEHRQCFDPTP